MQTIDIHTHLLNPDVRFDRLFDRLAVRFFAKGLGLTPDQLAKNPFTSYVDAMANAVRTSHYVRKTCLFGVDARLDRRGREICRDPTVCAMSDDVLRVYERFPDLFIPFLSVNPLRPNAMDLLDELHARGCRGAKFLQNYWGLDLNEEAFLPYFEKLKSLDLPLIVHIGSEYSIHSDKRYEGVEMLYLPLAAGVKVIAAHMGLGRFQHKLHPWRNISAKPGDFDRDYFRLLKMLEHYENLYADISAILVPLRARALRHLSEQTVIHHKILFGTDYPVPFPVRYNTYDLNADKKRLLSQIENPFDRYCSVILEYFPSDSVIYSNYLKVLPVTGLSEQTQSQDDWTDAV